MCAVHGPDASTFPNTGRIIALLPWRVSRHSRCASPAPSEILRASTDMRSSVLRHETSLIGPSRAGAPALREAPHALLGPWILRPGGNASRDAEALLDDQVVAEVGKALRRP